MITEVEVALRESSIPEKKLHGCLILLQLSYMEAFLRRLPTDFQHRLLLLTCQHEGDHAAQESWMKVFCVWAVLTPLCYPSVWHPASSLEETVFSWEKGLPVSAQEKHLSLRFVFMAEETSLSAWLLAQINVFILVMFYKPSSQPCTCLFYLVGKHWGQGHLHSADTLCTITDSEF